MPEKIPIGPQHPALDEPANFTLTVEGEDILDAELSISYNHRGIEEATQSRSYLDDLYLLSRICGICSHSHTTCFAQAVEELAGLDVPPRAQYIRTLIGELERLHSHLLWLGIAGHEMGFDTLWNYAWRDRELVLDLLEEITGNRVHYSINALGGVSDDLTPEQGAMVLENVEKVRERAEHYLDVVPHEETIRLRCQNVGTISEAEARGFCAVGPTARASNVPTDVRREDPYGAYDDLDFDVVLADDGDLLARMEVRLRELVESCDLCDQIVEEMPSGDLKASSLPGHAVSKSVGEGEAISRYEAPRGELIHYVESDGTENPVRVRVRPPTFANWPAVVEGLKGSYLADTPMVVAGIDPCISCTSRIGVEVADRTDGEDGSHTLGDLSEYAEEWYDQRSPAGER